MKNQYHWIPLYVDAWIVGTRDLTLEEQGAYLQLLLMQFHDGLVVAEKAEKVLGKENKELINGVLEQKFLKTTNCNGTGYENKRLKEIADEQHAKSQAKEQRLENARINKRLQRQWKDAADTRDFLEECKQKQDRRETDDLRGLLEKELNIDIEKEVVVNKSKQTKTQVRLTELETQMKDDWDKQAETESIPTMSRWSLKRRKMLEKAYKEGKEVFVSDWKIAITKLPIPNTESFRWQPTFDWLLNVDNVAKIIEGQFGEHTNDKQEESNQRSERVNRFLDAGERHN